MCAKWPCSEPWRIAANQRSCVCEESELGTQAAGTLIKARTHQLRGMGREGLVKQSWQSIRTGCGATQRDRVGCYEVEKGDAVCRSAC